MVFAHICCLCNKTIKLPYRQDGMFICNWCVDKLRKLLGIKVEMPDRKAVKASHTLCD
jgi:hypothetical protein